MKLLGAISWGVAVKRDKITVYGTVHYYAASASCIRPNMDTIPFGRVLVPLSKWPRSETIQVYAFTCKLTGMSLCNPINVLSSSNIIYHTGVRNGIKSQVGAPIDKILFDFQWVNASI